MRLFDPNVWRDRAWSRLTRIASDPTTTVEVLSATEASWAQDVVAVSDLEALVAWCSRRRLKVFFVKKPGGTYSSSDKTIEISSRLRPLNQLIVLLHECGHHLVPWNDRFDMGYPQIDEAVTRTFHHRVTCLEEEMEAWHRGWRLAVRLSLRLDRRQFDDVRLKCLRTYVKWVIKPGGLK
jgi:hypothetical protein